MRTVAIIQARMSSSRLPGKVAMDLGGKPVLMRVVERARQATTVDYSVVAIPYADRMEVAKIGLFYHYWYRGPEDDVLGRYVACTQEWDDADIIVRLTGDCPFIDPKMIDRCVSVVKAGRTEFASNVPYYRTGYPGGMDVEVFTRRLLDETHRNTQNPVDREHVTLSMRVSGQKPAIVYRLLSGQTFVDLSINTQADLDTARLIYKELGPDFSTARLVNWVDANKGILMTADARAAT